MSDEGIKKISSAAPAVQNQSSIMSAPREKNRGTRTILIIAALVISIIVNVVLAVVSLSKNERMRQLESEIDSNKQTIIELKEKLNDLNTL